MSLKNYLESNPLMDESFTMESGDVIEFNTVDECSFNYANLEDRHELISGKIAFVNGLLDKHRDLYLDQKSELKVMEAQLWSEYKNTKTDVNQKPLSDKRVDVEVQAADSLAEQNRKILNTARKVRRLEGFVTDLRGAKVAMETILKTRVV